MAGTIATAESGIKWFHWRLEILIGLTIGTSACTVGALSFSMAQILKDWALSPGVVGAIIVVNAVGSLLGAVLLGNLADRWGRKATLQIILTLQAVGTGLSGLAWDPASLATFQFIAGMGVGGLAPVAMTLMAEFAPAKHRGQLVGLTEMFWVAGWLFGSVPAYYLIPQYGWRAAFFWGALPALYIPVFRLAAPESLRYLTSRGRHDDASAFVRSVESRYRVKLEVGIPNPKPTTSPLARFAELWSSQFIRRTACTWILWFAMIYSFNGIFIWMPTLLVGAGQGTTRSFEFSLVITLAQAPGVLIAAALMDRIGRKLVVVPALALCGVAAFFFGQTTDQQALLIWGALMGAGNFASWTVIGAYTSELFPTRMRSTGTGLASACGRVGAIVVPAAMALLIGAWGSSYILLFGMFAAVLIGGALGVAILGEETVGRTLEDISR